MCNDLSRISKTINDCFLMIELLLLYIERIVLMRLAQEDQLILILYDLDSFKENRIHHLSQISRFITDIDPEK